MSQLLGTHINSGYGGGGGRNNYINASSSETTTSVINMLANRRERSALLLFLTPLETFWTMHKVAIISSQIGIC